MLWWFEKLELWFSSPKSMDRLPQTSNKILNRHFVSHSFPVHRECFIFKTVQIFTFNTLTFHFQQWKNSILGSFLGCECYTLCFMLLWFVLYMFLIMICYFCYVVIFNIIWFSVVVVFFLIKFYVYNVMSLFIGLYICFFLFVMFCF